MLKKIMAAAVSILMAVSLLAGCGSSSGTQDTDSKSVVQTAVESGIDPILPEKTTLTSLGSNSDDDSSDSGEEEESIENPEIFSARMFWGLWVREDMAGGTTSSDSSAASASYPAVEVQMEDFSTSIECLPAGFSLGTMQDSGFSTLSEKYSFADGTYGVVGFQKGNEDEGGEKSADDLAAEAQLGIRFGGPEGDLVFDTVYDVKDDTLGIGIVDKISEKNAGDDVGLVRELDYQFSWSGPYLTLTYGNESATYIPKNFADNNNAVLIESVECLSKINDDSIIDLAIGTDHDFIETKYGPDIEADYTLTSDGKMQVEDALGNDYGIRGFYYSGSTLTIEENDSVDIFETMSGVFSNRVNFQLLNARMNFGGTDNVDLCLNYPVSSLISSGFDTEANTDMNVPSNELASFDASYNGCTVHVKALNTYENEIPLSECTVASVIIDSDSGDASYSRSSIGTQQVGVSNYLDVKKCYDSIYQATPKSIIMKTGMAAPISHIGTIEEMDRHGNTVVEQSYDGEVVFAFDDDVLRAIRFEIPSYVYGGLNDNIDPDTLADMDQTEIDSTISVRENLLSKLEDAFAAAGVDVDIQSNTGVIRLSNDILFDTNEYNVTADGASYISQVMNVVSSVVLEQDVEDVISKVEIGGHTDQNGDYDDNYVLSVKRAEAVLDSYMNSADNSLSEAQKKEFENIVETKGYSFSNPVFSESGSVDAGKSRRVEVRFFMNTGAQGVSVGSSSGSTATEAPSPSAAADDSDTFSAGTIVTDPSPAYENDFLGIRISTPTGWSTSLGDADEMESDFESGDWYDDFSATSNNTAKMISVSVAYESDGITDQDIDEATNQDAADELVASYEENENFHDLSGSCTAYTIAGKRYNAIVLTGNMDSSGGDPVPFHCVICLGYKGNYRVQITLVSYVNDSTNEMIGMISEA